jgi:signal transduction histidine kinase
MTRLDRVDKDRLSIDMELVVSGLFYAVKDGLLMYAQEKSEELFVNKSFCKLLGYECTLFSEGHNIGILPPDLIELLRRDIPRLFTDFLDDYRQATVLDLVRSDGRNVKVALEHDVFESEDMSFHVFLLRDITWVTLLEKRKKNAERILNHDIRNQAGNFAQLASLIERQTQDEGVLELTGMLREEADKLTTLVDQDLSNFKLEEGAYELQCSQCNLNQIVNSILGQYQSNKEGLRVQLTYEHGDLHNGFDIYYYGDCLLIERMLGNLIKNAMEATQEAAPEMSDSRPVQCSLRESSSEVIIEVANQGAIPEEIRPGFLHEQVTSKKHGHGLGAYGARLIAEAHGGHIEFESNEQQGTTIRVHLPRESRAPTC